MSEKPDCTYRARVFNAMVMMLGKSPYIMIVCFAALIMFLGEIEDRGVTMQHWWSSNVSDAIVYAFMIVGILFALFVGYILVFEKCKKKNDDVLRQFDLEYVGAFFVSAILSGAIAWILIFYGLDISIPHTYDELGELVVTDPLSSVGYVALVCFVVGAFTAFAVDRCIVHPTVDGLITVRENKAKKEVLNRGLALTKDPETMAKITAKASALGLVDKTKVEKLGILVTGVDDPSFATYVQILKGQQ